MKKIFCLTGFAVLALCGWMAAGCAVVQETYVRTEVMDKESYCLDTEGENEVAFFGVYGKEDSTLVSKIVQNMAETFEAEKGLAAGTVYAYTIPDEEFKGFSDTLYMESLMVESASRFMVFLTELNLMQYKVDPNMSSSNSLIIDLPYAVTVSCYDGMKDTLLHKKRMREIITASTKSVAIPASAIAREIGKRSLRQVMGNWVEVTWPLMWYPDEKMWGELIKKVRDFKFKEAIDGWMKYYSEPANGSEKAKEMCACAAHNIAVCCELSGERELAKEWAKYAVAMYPSLDAAKRLVRRLNYLDE